MDANVRKKGPVLIAVLLVEVVVVDEEDEEDEEDEDDEDDEVVAVAVAADVATVVDVDVDEDVNVVMHVTDVTMVMIRLPTNVPVTFVPLFDVVKYRPGHVR